MGRNEGRQQAEAQQQGARGGKGGQGGARQEKDSPSGSLRGDLDHLKVNTSVQEGRAPEQHSQHCVEGRAPHRAEAFVAMKRSVAEHRLEQK